ncbi:MAG TPA: recombination regulator RecX [Burkholderiales bacterium]|nr:recombination regulator RecX [Burkholderiales bacterium]
MSKTLRERAIGLLARREHSRAELARKLIAHIVEGDDLSALLDDLERRKLLSDQRYAEARAHSLAPRYGSARIVQELRMQGVADTTQVAAALRSTEIARARGAWLKRFGKTPQSAEEKAKQYRFLQARGFSSEAIQRVIRESGSN